MLSLTSLSAPTQATRRYKLSGMVSLLTALTLCGALPSAHAAPLPPLASQAGSANNASNLDMVLSELSRQHNNPTALIASRQPNAALPLSSQLLNQLTPTVKPHNDSHPTQASQEESNDASLLERLSAVAASTVNRFSQTGVASWYGRQFNGKKTANGEVYDQNALTAAHKTLPLNCYIKVTNKSNGKSVVVKVNDRGPFTSNRMVDLSYLAAKQIGLTSTGSGNVVIERVDAPN